MAFCLLSELTFLYHNTVRIQQKNDSKKDNNIVLLFKMSISIVVMIKNVIIYLILINNIV